MTRQNGQPVAIFSAPVDRASSTRSRLIRRPIFSSIHIRAPPAPQQKERSACRGISVSVAPAAPTSARGSAVDLVVPAQVARVVVGHRRIGVRRGHRDEPALAHQRVEQLGVVHDLVVALELRVLAAEGVEAVRAGRDDLARAGLAALEHAVEELLGLRGHHLEQELVARPPRRVAGAGLLGAEHDVVHPGPVQQLRDRADGLLRLVVERPGAADPEQVLGVGGELAVEHRDVERQVLRPVEPVAGVLPPGVALVLQVAEQRRQLGRELGLDHDLVAAQVDDVVDVLDVDRALLDACPAGGARPQDVRVDHPPSASSRRGRRSTPQGRRPAAARPRAARRPGSSPAAPPRRRRRSRPPRRSCPGSRRPAGTGALA